MQYVINSRQNPKIINISKLHLKKYRNEQESVLLEGERIVLDAILQGVEIKTLVVLNDAADKFKDIVSKVNCDVLLVPQNILDILSSTQNSQGIMAVAKLKTKQFCMPKTNFLILDNIQDPGNLGTIIRTATALNYKYIYLYNCVDCFNDKVLRATMGTIFKQNLITVDIKDLEKLSKTYTLYLTKMDGADITNMVIDGQFGIVLGNEANGVSEDVEKLTHKAIAIKMQNGVESLNVAMAGGIVMFTLNNK